MALNKLRSKDAQLLHDLVYIRDDFFQAVTEGPEAATEFASRFTQLAEQTTSEHIQDIFRVDGNFRLAVTHNAVTTIGFVASGLCEVMKCADDLTEQLHLDIGDLLENLTLCNDTTSNHSTVYPTTSPTNYESTSTSPHSLRRRRLSIGSSTSSGMNDIGIPCYQSVSLRWLCDNLHNPYPSASTKSKIAESAGVDSKAVGEWFSQARRRIGWTTLLKKRFGGNRQLCIDCARNILIEGASCSFYSSEIAQDFHRMKSKLERMCRDRFGRSDVVEELADIQPTNSVYTGRRTGMKRRSSLISDCHQESNEFSEFKECSLVRPVKRMRESFPSNLPALSRATSFSASVSSRSSTVELLTPINQLVALPDSELDNVIGEWVSSVSTEALEDHIYERLHSRKRSSSDSDSRCSVKRIKQNESDTQRPGSLFESLPYSSRSGEQELLDLSDHFDFNFPPVASVDSELDDGGPLRIDLFSYANWDASQPDHPWKLYDECQSKTASGNVVPPTTDVVAACQDIATGFNSVTMNADLWCKQAEVIARGLAGANCLPPASMDDSFDLLSQNSPLGNTITLSAESHSSGVAETLPSLTTMNTVDEERLMKLTRINNLLAEAAQLQSEVFC